jgi:hypothetical protein
MKAQTWSFDIIVAVVIFAVAFLLFYYLLGLGQSSEIRDLQTQAEIVGKEITLENSSFSIIENDTINPKRLEELAGKNYSKIKRKLRIEGDFCIYIEDQDGNIIPVNDSVKAIGSPIINISDEPCG